MQIVGRRALRRASRRSAEAAAIDRDDSISGGAKRLALSLEHRLAAGVEVGDSRATDGCGLFFRANTPLKEQHHSRCHGDIIANILG